MTSVVRELAPATSQETAQTNNRQGETEMVKVSASSRPSAAAGAIAGIIRERGVVEVQSIGAGATNQAIKAVAIARSYLREENVDLICTPSFLDVVIDGEKRTAICLLVERRAAVAQ
ncbi:MAG: stage V sporulation protein S [Roseiflexaceae bacterium]